MRAQLASAVGLARLRAVHVDVDLGGTFARHGLRGHQHLSPAVGGGQGQGQHELRRDVSAIFFLILNGDLSGKIC